MPRSLITFTVFLTYFDLVPQLAIQYGIVTLSDHKFYSSKFGTEALTARVSQVWLACAQQ